MRFKETSGNFFFITSVSYQRQTNDFSEDAYKFMFIVYYKIVLKLP